VVGVPRLSADGRTVALIGNPTEATNVFIVDMSEGLSRQQAVRQLTREIVVNPLDPAAGVNAEGFIPLNGHIFDLGISADGRRLAFATARQLFPLAPPYLVGSAPSALGVVELYRIDVSAGTLERVTHGHAAVDEPSLQPHGRPRDGDGAVAPSIGGGEIAFASTASNLVESDGNEASDVFLVEEARPPHTPGRSDIPEEAPVRFRQGGWRLALSAFSLPGGRVRLVAVVPAAGGLRAGAEAELAPGARPRRLTGARARARRQGKVEMTLKLPRRLRRLARSREGLYATAEVTFTHPGRRTLRGALQVRFQARPSRRGGRR
jgi:hypothetical protein